MNKACPACENDTLLVTEAWQGDTLYEWLECTYQGDMGSSLNDCTYTSASVRVEQEPIQPHWMDTQYGQFTEELVRTLGEVGRDAEGFRKK